MEEKRVLKMDLSSTQMALMDEKDAGAARLQQAEQEMAEMRQESAEAAALASRQHEDAMERMAGDFRMEREKIANKERINAGQQQRRSDAAEQALRLEIPLVEAAFAKVSKESDEWKDRFEAMRAALRARESVPSECGPRLVACLHHPARV